MGDSADFVEVFNTIEGFRILKYMYRIARFDMTFNNNVNEIIYRKGQQDLVKAMMNLAGITESHIKNNRPNQTAGLGKRMFDIMTGEEKERKQVHKELRESFYVDSLNETLGKED